MPVRKLSLGTKEQWVSGRVPCGVLLLPIASGRVVITTAGRGRMARRLELDELVEIPADPRRTAQARPPRQRIHHPPRPQGAEDPVMAEYTRHYNGRRPHRALQLQPPRPDHPVADLSQERVKRRPVLGGLLNEYERAA